MAPLISFLGVRSRDAASETRDGRALMAPLISFLGVRSRDAASETRDGRVRHSMRCMRGGLCGSLRAGK